MSDTSKTLHVLADDGSTQVDWWFIYKLPKDLTPTKGAAKRFGKTSGYEYLYFDAREQAPLALSDKRLDGGEGALHATLSQIYDAPNDPSGTLGWICYNDEVADGGSNDDEKGHTKGVLCFDLASDTAFWLLHSWPKFPNTDTAALPSPIYGQTFLCVALKNVDAARQIAEQMFHRQEPQTYQCQIPTSLPDSDIFNRVANDIDVNETDPPCDITFLSRAGANFRLLAKNRHWAKDFWIDLVGPHLMADLEVETWRRGTVPTTADSDGKHAVADALYINLEKLEVPYEWKYTKDHAKWGVSKGQDWVCVADINRMTSQEKRGGGTIAFKSAKLWQCLAELEQLKP